MSMPNVTGGRRAHSFTKIVVFTAPEKLRISAEQRRARVLLTCPVPVQEKRHGGEQRRSKLFDYELRHVFD